MSSITHNSRKFRSCKRKTVICHLIQLWIHLDLLGGIDGGLKKKMEYKDTDDDALAINR